MPCLSLVSTDELECVPKFRFASVSISQAAKGDDFVGTMLIFFETEHQINVADFKKID